MKRKEEIDTRIKKNKMSPRQKEIILTISILLVSIVVGFIVGKILFDTMYR